MASSSGFELNTELAVQGLTGLFIFLWALKGAIPAYKAMRTAARPNPLVAGMSMAWDRDMQERFLQIMERMALAAEAQARNQAGMADTWSEMADQRQRDMNTKIDDLMVALRKKEDDLSAMISKMPAAGRPRR